MLLFSILIVIGCTVLFIAGIITGYALRNRRIKDLEETNEFLGDTNATIRKALDETNTNHNILINEHQTLYDSFNQLRKNLSDYDLEHRKLIEAHTADRQIISDYQKTVFENANKLQQLETLQKENRIFTVQIAVQNKRIAELEARPKQQEQLEQVTRFARGLKAQNTKLQNEIALLKKRAGPPILFTNLHGFKTITSNAPVEEVCRRILTSAISHRNNRGAVICDDSGFVVVGSSEQADELSGISTILHYCEKVLNSNIPFGNIAKIIIKNANNCSLTIIPFIVNGQMVFYSGLSQGLIKVGPHAGKVTGALVIN